MSNYKPLIAISAGDPAGIGPEISIKALVQKSIYEICRPMIVCDIGIIRQVINFLGLELSIHEINSPDQWQFKPGLINVLNISNINIDEFKFNQIQGMTGNASFEYVEKVIALALDNKIDATVTGPIHKEAIQSAGHHYAGHTEIFADYTNTQHYAMMLAEGSFRVIHVSTHVALKEAIKRVKKDRVLEVIRLAQNGLKQMGIENPRIAVAGLNPHAGESGLFGSEEIEEIIPAVEQAKLENILAEGPFPPDTIFPKMKGGQYDIVVCMYHDQGHIPTKLLGFNYDHEKNVWDGMSGVNITLGLPIIRVSVDHGVAFDKGGMGIANPDSMIQAIEYAVKLAGHKHQ